MKQIYETILSYRADEFDAGRTSESILKREFNISSGLFKVLKLSGKIMINSIPCRSVDTVNKGDIVSANIEETEFSEIPEYDFDLEILFEDAHIMVVNKPAGLSMHPCRGEYEKTLSGAIIKHWRMNSENHNFHAVNRLDKDTSGICIIAKNRYSHAILSQQAKDLIKKEYSTIVHGKIDKQGTVDLPIKRDNDSIIKRTVSTDGKTAITEYTPVISNSNYSLLKVKLLTGRTHQIRVHFSHIGHPLYGDWLYGFGDSENELISRHALVSDRIKFCHPISKELLDFKIELPQDMKELLLKLNNL